MTVDRLPDSTAGRPLAAFIDATQGAVPVVQDADEPDTGYRAVALLSGHLAAMWRTVYPQAAGRPGADGQLRAVCLSRGREVEWTLRLFQCQLSGEVSAVGRPATAVLTLLAQRLDSYRRLSGRWSPGWRTSWPPRAVKSWPGSTGARLPTRPPAPIRGVPAPDRCAMPVSGCTAAGTGCSTRWTPGPAWATISPCRRLTAGLSPRPMRTPGLTRTVLGPGERGISPNPAHRSRAGAQIAA